LPHRQVGCLLPLAISYWLEHGTKSRFLRERCGARLVVRAPRPLAAAAARLSAWRRADADSDAPRGRAADCAPPAAAAVLPSLLLALLALAWMAADAAVTLSSPPCAAAAAASAAAATAAAEGFCAASAAPGAAA
jgi:hypothetical protein